MENILVAHKCTKKSNNVSIWTHLFIFLLFSTRRSGLWLPARSLGLSWPMFCPAVFASVARRKSTQEKWENCFEFASGYNRKGIAPFYTDCLHNSEGKPSFFLHFNFFRSQVRVFYCLKFKVPFAKRRNLVGRFCSVNDQLLCLWSFRLQSQFMICSYFLTDQRQLRLTMVSAVANGYDNGVSLDLTPLTQFN